MKYLKSNSGKMMKFTSLVNNCPLVKILFALHIFSIFNSIQLNAQRIQIQALPPNPYQIKSEDIFNLQITNPTSIAIEVVIKGVWNYQGVKAVELTSDRLTLNPGMNSIQSASVNISSKTYSLAVVDEMETSTGMMPPGNYKACIFLQCATPNCNGAGNDILAMETAPCFEVKVEQPTPLLLSNQPNGNVSNIRRPAFAWIPPMPMGNNPALRYTLILVKKNDKNQSCTDAVTRNRPLYKEDQIEGNLKNYPADIDELEDGDYAWQVKATYEGFEVASSEAWCFRVEEKKELLNSVIIMPLPAEQVGLGFYTINKKDTLNIKLTQEYKVNKTDKFEIYLQKGQSGQRIELNKYIDAKMHLGLGVIKIPLNEVRLQKIEYINLNVSTTNGEMLMARLRIIE